MPVVHSGSGRQRHRTRGFHSTVRTYFPTWMFMVRALWPGKMCRITSLSKECQACGREWLCGQYGLCSRGVFLKPPDHWPPTGLFVVDWRWHKLHALQVGRLNSVMPPQQLIWIDCTGGGGDEFTVDSIKTYEVSQVKDVSKHDPGMQHDAAAGNSLWSLWVMNPMPRRHLWKSWSTWNRSIP